ncbi:ATP-binding protein [Puniceicoccaceae bacterium K14]|nr:ATP-binding protein [Puniceicoccaceae bacterium K14]
MDLEEKEASMMMPNWLFEQDYLVFVAFVGWTLLGMLAWTKPLENRSWDRLPWLWFGYFGFAQAIAEFIRILSFSDPFFFRSFAVSPAFEMLGFGVLLDFVIRVSPRFRRKSLFPYGAVSGFLLGFSIDSEPSPYSLTIAILLASFAIVTAGYHFFKQGRKFNRPELYFLGAGLALTFASWALNPDLLVSSKEANTGAFPHFPDYGFGYLMVRILAAWLTLGAFWAYRVNARIVEVTPKIGSQLKVLGFRVMPGSLLGIVFICYLLTSWNGNRIKESMEQDYVFRSQTAALAMDPQLPLFALLREDEAAVVRRQGLESQLLAIQNIGTNILSVYLWQGDDDRIVSISNDSDADEGPKVVSVVHEELLRTRDYIKNESFMVGPIAMGNRSILNISSPILDADSGEAAYWLGIDIAADSWVINISMGRLQIIIIAGLLTALAVFFIYFQVEHESEADLLLEMERSKAGDQAKSEFLAVISHEIRTPLQSVLGYSDLLRSTPLNDKQRSCLDTIQSEGKILLRIVQDILDFSNLRKVNFELKDGKVYLRRIIEETFRTIKPMAEKRDLTAELVIDDDLPNFVEADGVRLRQVLLNLFGNSVKYTERGLVRLRVECATTNSIIDSEGEHPRKAVQFIIEDTGIGIKEEDLERLFEPFIQLEHSDHLPREGAGLGLAIVNRIIELMGGKIVVKSVIGEGSTFIVSFNFPLLEDEEFEPSLPMVEEPSEAVDTTALGERFPMKVLVADDNPMVRKLVVQYLNSLGYEVDAVDGGVPASEVGASYDLVVIDLRMPEVDGPQAASNIRDKSGLAEKPWIIGVSATLAEKEIERALSMGINSFLGKPFTAEALAEQIAKIPWIFDCESSDDEEFAEELELEEELEIPPPEESVTGGGMGVFSNELIDAAAKEVLELHNEMKKAHESDDYEYIQDKAHYLANTAMAIGIDDLYHDSKALEKSAEEKAKSEVDQKLVRLRDNFVQWNESR